MRILVIGGTSFIGPHVVERVVQLGHEVAVFHRGETHANLASSVRVFRGDRRRVADSADELQRFAPDVVLDMILATEENARTLMAVFGRVAERVVAISSQDVYRGWDVIRGRESGPPDPVPYPEEGPLRSKLFPDRDRATGPDDMAYDYDKILVERVILGDPCLPGTVLRLPMVYGPRDPIHRTFRYLKRMDDHRPAILLDEGEASWRWSRGYVENVAAAVVLAVTEARAAGRVYNVADEPVLTLREWVEAIGLAVEWQGRIVLASRGRLPDELTMRIRNPEQHLMADTRRIREELGYREIIPLREALRRTVVWQRKHPPNNSASAEFDYTRESAILVELGFAK